MTIAEDIREIYPGLVKLLTAPTRLAMANPTKAVTPMNPFMFLVLYKAVIS